MDPERKTPAALQQLVWDTYDRKRTASKEATKHSSILDSNSIVAKEIEEQSVHPINAVSISAPLTLPLPPLSPFHKSASQVDSANDVDIDDAAHRG